MAELKNISIESVRRRGSNVRFNLILFIEQGDKELTRTERVNITREDGESFFDLVARMITQNASTFDDIINEVEFMSEDSDELLVLSKYARGLIEEWEMPEGSHDAPNMGDLRSHEGSIWESTMDGNITEPSQDDPISEWDHIMDIPGTNDG